MIEEKTQRELLDALDFANASMYLSNLPVNSEKVERYKAMIRGGITAENLLKVMDDDRQKILQSFKPGDRLTE